MRILLCFILLGLSHNCFATSFKLASLQRYGTSPGMELFLSPTGGSSIAKIFSVIEFSERQSTIRLIGESSDFTNNELLAYYKEHYPKELEVALDSSGNLHNPAINGVRVKFPDALRSTTIYKQLLTQLNQLGYRVSDISFEKFTISKEHGVSIPDVYIKVEKNA